MKKVRFVGLDVHADTIAVAVAEPGGTVRSVGMIPNRPESTSDASHQSSCRSVGASKSSAIFTRYIAIWRGRVTVCALFRDLRSTILSL